MDLQRISVRHKGYYFVGVQAVVLLIATVVTFILFNAVAAYSVLLGGLASILPNLLFAWWLFGDTRARAAKQIVFKVFFGEFAKLFLSGLLFVLIIKLMTVSAAMVVAGFITATIAFLLTPLFFKG